ncbi:BICD family-like cargo adapter 1 [Protopterus annectens]|uniref:BICD family-like cargo adapter 1 n=1 Tax=Protopterus annectens TaxID=7888 RepID=UPI001CFB2FC6|nr:BICD family-like cargo adapter 1 [Protopterus annectens]
MVRVKMLQAEQGLVAEVQALREDSKEGVQSFYREAAQTHVFQQEVVELAQQKHNLEQQLAAFFTQNALLQNTVTTLKNELSALDRHSQDQLVQLQQSEQNSKEAWALNRELQAKLQEMQEDMPLRGFKPGESSLLSEIEESMDAESWENNEAVNSVEPHDHPCPVCQKRFKDLENVSEHQAVLEKLQSEIFKKVSRFVVQRGVQDLRLEIVREGLES